MKKLLAIATLITTTLVMVSCGDDDGGTTTFDQPAVTVTTSGDIANGATDGTVAFNVTLDADLSAAADWVLTSTGVTTATIDGATEGTIAAPGGAVTVAIDAGTTAGGATVTLTVTNPSEDTQGLSGTATASFSVLDAADNTITFQAIGVDDDGDPDEDILTTVGAAITLPNFSIDAADGIASLTLSIAGADEVDLIAAGATDAAGTAIAAGQTAVAGLIIPGSVTDNAAVADDQAFRFTVVDANSTTSSASATVDIAEAVASYSATASTDLQGNTAFDVVGEIAAGEIVSWDAANVYVITGRLIVSGTLNIPAGTIIKGETGSGVNAKAMIVAIGGTLNVSGSAAAPVIMTSINDGISPGEIEGTLANDVNGLWGGLIVLGDATISASNTTVQIEGIPTSVAQGQYGGSDDDDNSGTISYLSLRHGGSNIGAGNEINGITFGGVGSGTTVNHVEVVANQDDGIEFFGGNVSVTNAVVWNCGDDSMDTDQDWQGSVTNFIIVTPTGGSPFEMDGPEGADARTTPGFCSFDDGDIFFGGEVTDHVVDWDGSTNAQLTDLFFFGFPTGYPDADSADPIESFGGDDAGTSANWQAVIPSGATVDGIFFEVVEEVDTPIGIVTAVASESVKTVGADETVFGWTLYSVSGQLASDYAAPVSK